ncbi:hypothetical protein [Gemmata sp.]|uniref:hypothetical protein n=1 Tax=Gemmata sp. TaxID=1914242 RepID=UPI003F72C7C5
MNRYFTLAIAIGLVALAGCGKKEGHLSGTVTFKGKPVESGEIILSPDGSRGNSGPGVMVPIERGTFRTPTQRGHWGGPYLARVTCYKGQDTLIGGYEMQIDLPEGDTTYDLVIPDEAAAK